MDLRPVISLLVCKSSIIKIFVFKPLNLKYGDSYHIVNSPHTLCITMEDYEASIWKIFIICESLIHLPTLE